MIYLTNYLAVFLFCIGIALSMSIDPVDSGFEIKKFNEEECTLIVKNSVWWSMHSEEYEITGPCDKLIEAM